MRQLILGFALLVSSLVLVSTNGFSLEEYHFFGEWEVVMMHDVKTGEKFKTGRNVYFQFYEDGNLTIHNVAQRTRSEWTWSIKGDKLRLISKAGRTTNIGKVTFYKKSNGDLKRKFKFKFYKKVKEWTGGETITKKAGPFTYILDDDMSLSDE